MSFSKIARILLKFTLLFVAIFSFVYIAVNGPALYQKISYWYITKFKKGTWPKSYQIAPHDVRGDLGYILAPQKKASEPQISKSQGINLENNYLYIPKLGIKAPINWEIEERNAIAALESGVTHLKGTGLPGTDGNIFITGHSSYYWWARGNYKTVFALLPNIQKGDKIYLTYNNKLYTYETVETLTVSPKDVWVMDKLNYPALTLMTCVPIGTNLRRFIVRSKQIFPALEKSKPKIHTPSLPKNIPDLLPSIF